MADPSKVRKRGHKHLNRGHGSLLDGDVEDAASLSLRFLGDVNSKDVSDIFGVPGKLPPQLVMKRDGQLVMSWCLGKKGSTYSLYPRQTKQVKETIRYPGHYAFVASLPASENDKNIFLNSVGAHKWMKRLSNMNVSRFSVKVSLRVQGKHNVLFKNSKIIEVEVKEKVGEY